MKVVIKKERINKNYGIDLNIAPYSNINQNDTNYLQTLLIKPKNHDSIESIDSNGNVLVSNISWPDKNLLTQEDIDHMLCTRQEFKILQWDISKLGFYKPKQKYYYSFSIPYFTKNHNKVIIMYEFLCPGLCGTGKTIVLNKRRNDWYINTLESWMH